MIREGEEFRTHNDARVKVRDFKGEFVRLKFDGFAPGYVSLDSYALKELRKFLKELQKQLEGNAS